MDIRLAVREDPKVGLAVRPTIALGTRRRSGVAGRMRN